MDIPKQLEMLGIDETKRQLVAFTKSKPAQAHLASVIDTSHDILTSLPEDDELGFLHSGLCQTCLPHSKPAHAHTVWRRTSGRFSLSITPGVLTSAKVSADDDGYVGVPYGPKARLILIHLQTEGLKSRTVNLGPSLSAFLHSLRLPVTGGTIAAIRAQSVRISQCSFSLEWSATDDLARIIQQG